MTHFDVVVVGGGLTGNHAGWLLSRAGLRVAILEEHPVIGRPWFCTGIVGKRGFDNLDFPSEFIQQELGSATFFSPSGRKLRVARKETQAYVINRAAFDFYLAEMALKAGARLMTSTRCTGIKPERDRVRVSAREGRTVFDITAGLCILSTGVRYGFHEALGLGRPGGFLDSAQVEVEGYGFKEVEVYLGEKISPSSFSWSVPVGEDRVRIGVTARAGASKHLEALLGSPQLRPRIREIGATVSRRVIPLGPVGKSYAHRLLAVGDAAGAGSITA